MKLRNLKGAIRKAPLVKFAMNGPMGRVDIVCVKSELMTDLDRLHGGDGQAETGLWVNDDGFLTRETDAPSPVETAPAPAPAGGAFAGLLE